MNVAAVDGQGTPKAVGVNPTIGQRRKMLENHTVVRGVERLVRHHDQHLTDVVDGDAPEDPTQRARFVPRENNLNLVAEFHEAGYGAEGLAETATRKLLP